MKSQLLIELWKKPEAQLDGMSGKKTLSDQTQELFLFNDFEGFIKWKTETRLLQQHVEVMLMETEVLRTFHFFPTVTQQFSLGK